MDSFLYTLRKLGRLAHRRRFNRDLEEEMEFHRRQSEQDRLQEGAGAAEAGLAARRQFGNDTLMRERTRDVVAFAFEAALQDVKFAFRHLRKNPGFAVTAILILGLGIGATTAIFSAVNPILFQALPYPGASRVAAISEVSANGAPARSSFGMYKGFSERSHSFESLAVYGHDALSLVTPESAEQLETQYVSFNYFHVVGVAPARGRDFQRAEDRLHGPTVVILSDALWRRRFHADPNIVGQQITLERSAGFAASDRYTIIGVMPRGFDNVMDPAAEMWTLVQVDIAQDRSWGHWLRMVGRLRPGVTMSSAEQELDGLGRELLQQYHPPTYPAQVRFAVSPLQEDVTRGVKPALLAVLAGVFLVLVIACVNVGNLLLARGVLRGREFAVRAALGAQQGRLLRQLLTENLLLAFVGGAAGISVAVAGIRWLVALSPPDLPRLSAITLDGWVLLFSLGVTTVVGTLVGAVPAIQAARRDPNTELQHGARLAGAGHRRLRNALVVGEVALALVLLVSSGLLLRSLQTLFAVPPGFDASHVLTMQVQEVGHRFDKDKVRAQFWDQALAAVRQLPGVTSAAFTSQLPLSGDDDQYGAATGTNPNPKLQATNVFRYAVTPEYFEAMRIPLLRGRALQEGDREGAPLAAVISASLAHSQFHDQDPIGQRVSFMPAGPFTIVGVVGDVKQMSLGLTEADAVYTSMRQWAWVDTDASLALRTRGDAGALAGPARSAIQSLDHGVPVTRMATMESVLAATAAQRHFVLLLFELFAVAALVLAALGIYGVLAGSVAERGREIGVRAALGATPGSILGMVLRQGMSVAGLGALLGLAAAVVATRGITALLFGISRLDAVTYATVLAVLALVALGACSLPAWRAAQVDPATTLRSE